MDNSNIEETEKNENLNDKCKNDKRNSENPNTLEPLAKNEPFISPAKRKSELAVQDETKRRRSTESTQREDSDDNLANQKNVKGAISITGHSEKSHELLLSADEIHGMEDNADKHTKKVNDSSLLDDVFTDVNTVESKPHMLGSTKFSDNIKESMEKQSGIIIEAGGSTNNEANFQITSKPDLKVNIIQIQNENLYHSDEFVRSNSNLLNKLFLKNNSSTCDRDDSVCFLKTEEIDKQYVTEDQCTCKSKKSESKSVKIDKRSKTEDLQKENSENDTKEHSKFQETDEIFQKYEKRLLHDSQTISPVKRKSELTAEDEIKRRRNIHHLRKECDDKSLINRVNLSDTVLLSEPSKTSRKIVTTASFTQSIKKEAPKTQDRMIKNVEDKSTSQETKKHLESKTYKMPTDQTSTSQSVSGVSARLEGSAARIRLVDRKLVSFNKSLHSSDTFNKSESGLSKEKYSEYIDVTSANSPEKVTEEEMIDSKENMFSTAKNETDSNGSDTETDKLKVPGMMINRRSRISRNTSLSVTSDKKPEDPNINKSYQEKVLPRENPHSSLPNKESYSRGFPKASSSANANFHLHPIYTEPESKYVPVEQYKNDPEIVESQKQILASIEQQSTRKEQLNLESESGPIDDFLSERCLTECFGPRSDVGNFLKNSAMDLALCLFRTYPEVFDDENSAKLVSLLRDVDANFWDLTQRAILAMKILLRNNINPLEFRENDMFSDAMLANEENNSPKRLPDLNENNFPKSMPDLNENDSPKSMPDLNENDFPKSMPDLNENNFPKSMPDLNENYFPKSMPDLNENDSPKSMPYLYENDSPKSLPDFNENNSPKSLPREDEIQNFLDFLDVDDPVSPIISPLRPSKDKTGYETSEMNFPLFREYPGLAEEPDKVKKDARYQKKFYRQRPIKLPINWNIGNCSTEPDFNINSEGDEIQIIEDPQNLVDENHKYQDEKLDEVSSDEEERKSQDDDQALLKEHYTDVDRESHYNTFSEALQHAGGYKISSFMEESPTSPTSSSNKSDSPEKK